MYGVIYWSKDGNRLDIVQNRDGSVMAFSRVEEADAKASEVETELVGVEDARTISLESVGE